MKSNDIRKLFFEFFESKQHQIVASAPIVVKNDPTLMFTNAGMNQFKDIFLGNSPVKFPRIANTQKCLRVSGKHNDLEEVGLDTYHHTMFEMLGNWSFGDYFKDEATAWAWEFLTEICKIPKDRLYITIFGGDVADNLEADEEAYNYWKRIVAEDRIIRCSKKDNFWEMGETGPCGPCSEVHVDIREDSERLKTDGRDLVNQGLPTVIEIWNLVFIQYNRMANGSLQLLPNKHVDTGMGFERLTTILQQKQSNYDTDIFQPVIQEIARTAGKEYGKDEKVDIAIRVIADHLRAVSFTIADGQLPSNAKAGYVIRRILRRAVRYGYTFLGFDEPFMYKLVAVLSDQFGETFPEIKSQQVLVEKVIKEEEASFLRTLSVGIQRFDNYIQTNTSKTTIVNGDFAFELFDTFGFPIDLTQLLAKEKDWTVDFDGFKANLEIQKERSRQAATVETEDWVQIKKDTNTDFIGYDQLEAAVELIKYRKVKTKDKEYFQLVFDKTPFYGESGGQVGDAGYLENEGQIIPVTTTKKENTLIIHHTDTLPSKLDGEIIAHVDIAKRTQIANNHSATHLLQSALQQVLGMHIEQKGSLVSESHLRFDFSHFQKLSADEIKAVEKIVNKKIRENIVLEENRQMNIADAKKLGAMALFGEKYEDKVRVIIFDRNYSIELCGGTHVPSTGQIGMIKIISESAIAAGVRRIEAVTADKAEALIEEKLAKLDEVNTLFNHPADLSKAVKGLLEENSELTNQLNLLLKEKVGIIHQELKTKIETIGDINYIGEILSMDPASIKDLAFKLKNEITNLFLVIASNHNNKPTITVMISENLVKDKNINASKIVGELAKEIQGGGGGQPFFATAGGKNSDGIVNVLPKAKQLVIGL